MFSGLLANKISFFIILMSYLEDKAFRPYRRYTHQDYDARYNQRDDEEGRRFKFKHSPQQESMQSSPSFQRSPQQYEQYSHNQPRDKEPVWEQLYRQGINSKKMLTQQHEKNKNRLDIECTFQPIIRTNKRYLANSNSTFLERVHIWQQHKIEKMLKEKEDEVDKGLKECTFVPKINKTFKKHQQNRGQEERLDKSQAQLKKRNRTINPYYSPIKASTAKKQMKLQLKTPTKSNRSYIDLSGAKELIRNQLKRIAL